MISIQQMDEALSCLEEVAVRLKRRKLNVELERLTSLDFLDCRRDLEWILNKFTACFIHHLEQGPI